MTHRQVFIIQIIDICCDIVLWKQFFISEMKNFMNLNEFLLCIFKFFAEQQYFQQRIFQRISLETFHRFTENKILFHSNTNLKTKSV